MTNGTHLLHIFICITWETILRVIENIGDEVKTNTNTKNNCIFIFTMARKLFLFLYNLLRGIIISFNRPVGSTTLWPQDFFAVKISLFFNIIIIIKKKSGECIFWWICFLFNSSKHSFVMITHPVRLFYIHTFFLWHRILYINVYLYTIICLYVIR